MSAIAAVALAMCIRASLLHGAAYNSVAGGTNTVVLPNDADSPYTLAEIAENIGDSAVFGWHASSNTAICRVAFKSPLKFDV